MAVTPWGGAEQIINLQGVTSGGVNAFISLLPFIEQSTLYSAYNANWSAWGPANSTITGVSISGFVCPSDSQTAGAFFTFPRTVPDGPTAGQRFTFTSYAGSSGSLTQTYYNLPVWKQANGILYNCGSFGAYSRSPVRASEITDGLSNTIAFGEVAHGLLSKTDQPNSGYGGSFYYYHHWTAWEPGGGPEFSEYYPINAIKKYKPAIGSSYDFAGAVVRGASSFHPGGANFAFCDGSVRFLKDTIDSWSLQPAVELPVGMGWTSVLGYTPSPGMKIGVYQALGTKSGGEVISANSY